MTPRSRSAFTLLEMMISILIFSLISIYLYQTLGTLRASNDKFGERVSEITEAQLRVKTLFLDLALSQAKSVTIDEADRGLDELWMQTTHSLHRRTLPYVGYLIRDRVLYRVESPRLPSDSEPLEVIEHIVVDKLGPVERFRVYAGKSHFLVDFKPRSERAQLFKIPALNH
jgi:prepilin-type N-terminal cleavage/methylation domain-containing protein